MPLLSGIIGAFCSSFLSAQHVPRSQSEVIIFFWGLKYNRWSDDFLNCSRLQKSRLRAGESGGRANQLLFWLALNKWLVSFQKQSITSKFTSWSDWLKLICWSTPLELAWRVGIKNWEAIRLIIRMLLMLSKKCIGPPLLWLIRFIIISDLHSCLHRSYRNNSSDLGYQWNNHSLGKRIKWMEI